MSEPLRRLGLVSATTVVAASMIGAGVYTTSGFTIAALPSPWLVILAWAVGGFVAICGAIGYSGLASRFPQSGGEYLFLGVTLHPVAGLMAGWVSLLAGFTSAIAIAALTCEAYLRSVMGSASAAEIPPAGSIAVALVLLAAILHTLSIRPSALAQEVVVGLKLLMIGGFIVVACFAPGHRWSGWAGPPTADDFSVRAFATSLLYISFSYAGFNAAIYIAGEVKRAERNVPRAMIGGTALVALLYVTLNAIFVLGPEMETVRGQEQIAAIAADSIGGPGFAWFVSVVIVVSLFTSVSALVMTGPRVYAKMADDGFLPAWFRFRDRPPAAAIWFQAVAAIVVIGFAGLQSLLAYLGFTLSLCSALTVSMLFRVRHQDRGLAVRLTRWAAGIFVIATCVTAGIAAVNEPLQAVVAAGTLGLGALIYPFVKRKTVKAAPPLPSPEGTSPTAVGPLLAPERPASTAERNSRRPEKR